MKNCNMVIIEDADLKYWRDCSNCEMKYKDTRNFRKVENVSELRSDDY